MIPRILHSRSTLYSYMTDFEDGAWVFGVSRDTYPELFNLAHPEIVGKSPSGWRSNQAGNFRYLWFPPDVLDRNDIDAIADWRDRFGQYVLIGLNKHISMRFTNELDFCLALDFNYDPRAEKRTLYGEAEYQLKYQRSRPYLKALQAGLQEALDDLPIPEADQDRVLLSCIPSYPDRWNVPKMLAVSLTTSRKRELIQTDLHCEKVATKGLPVEEKIPSWQKLYKTPGCIVCKGDMTDRTVVVIDDLYQSGATMWCYAQYLKQCGAKYVIGLICVKSLRDTDNR